MGGFVRASDGRFMARALWLASQGGRSVHPNPYVGSVVVQRGRVIGEGWHRRCGEAHAEVLALAAARRGSELPLTDATLYTTLAPCTHQGRTPACVDAILQHGIARVVVAARDPNPQATGGIEALRQAGIQVREGIKKKTAEWQNRRFFTYIQRQRPYIILKWAESAEGHLCALGASATPMMTHLHTRYLTHQWRSAEDAILVGRQTAALDDPQLNVRFGKGPSPLRIVLDPHAQLLPQLRLFTDKQAPTIAFAYEESLRLQKKRRTHYQGIPKKDFLHAVLRSLYARGVLSLIVEGGPTTLATFVSAGLWDEARLIRTPYALPSGRKAPVLAGAKRIQSQFLTADTLHLYRSSR